MSDDYQPQMADYDGVKLDNETYNDLLNAAEDNTTRNVNESADKIVLKTQVKRGDGTRDQDKIDVKVKGDNPDDTAYKLRETLDALAANGVSETLRNTQPGNSDD